MGNQASRRRNEEAQRRLILEAELKRQQRLQILQYEERQRQVELQRSMQILQYQERQRQLELQRSTSLVQHSVINPPRDEVYDSQSVSKMQKNFDYSLLIVNYIANHSLTSGWAPMASCDTVTYIDLLSSSQEYVEIARLFKSTNKKYFKVSRIVRIQNPYLYGAYLLKKEELTSRLGHPEETFLFHGTKERNVDNICEDNLDWRLHGKGTGHRFGKGVSFSPISNYATHYCDKNSNIKVMLVVKVLISRSCVGSAEMIIPPNGFDTTQKGDGHVIVKYYDNEYYPAYKLYFTEGGSDM